MLCAPYPTRWKVAGAMSRSFRESIETTDLSLVSWALALKVFRPLEVRNFWPFLGLRTLGMM